jgi:hypothetical protein
VRGPRDGDVGKSAVDEFRVNVGIHVHQDMLCGEPL